MKALKYAALSVLFGGPVFAGQMSPQAIMEDLNEAAEGELVELADQSLTDCADFSGSWAGTCAIKIERGEDVVNTTEAKTIAIAQEGCQKVEIDGKKFALNVAANTSLSSKQGFLHAQGGVYWMEGGQALGLSKEASGMAFKEGAAFKKMMKNAVLRPGATQGTAQLDAVVVVKKYKDDRANEEVEKTKATISCPLSLGAAHH